MIDKNLVFLARKLHDARLTATPVGQLSKDLPDLNRMDAYAIQENQLKLREVEQEILIGWKMGLTSEAKRKQMNLDSPLYGFLTNKMQVKQNGTFFLEGSIHPKIEPEIAFLINKDLHYPVNREQVLAACSAVAACMEILDSRYELFKYFSMEDVIADNSSSSHFVVGEWLYDFKHLDLLNLKMNMTINNSLSQSGISSDISGDPVSSIIELVELLDKRQDFLKAGSIVLAGAATPAVELKTNWQIQLKVDGLSPVDVFIK